MIKRLILGLLLIILVVLFTLNNTAPTELVLVGMSVHVPLALLLVISLALGAGLTIAFLLVPAFRERRELRECRRQLNMAKARLEELSRRVPAIPPEPESLQGAETPPSGGEQE